MNRKFVAKSNYVLRKVLNSEDNVDILREFIEVILNIKIKKAGINPYLEKRKKNLPAEENFGIADLRIQTEDKEELNIGIQMIDGEHVLTKMFLYFAQIHLNQIEYDDRRELARTITINILDFIFIPKTKYHSRMIFKKEEMKEIYKDCLEMHMIELPKFSVNLNQEITLKEAWINYLKGENIEKAIRRSKKIKKLDNLLNTYWQDEVME